MKNCKYFMENNSNINDNSRLNRTHVKVTDEMRILPIDKIVNENIRVVNAAKELKINYKNALKILKFYRDSNQVNRLSQKNTKISCITHEVLYYIESLIKKIIQLH